jgi:uncharacterized membrane protein YGL010W
VRTVDQWLTEYGESHQNPTNKGLHWVCVPIIVVSVIGLLWSLPVPVAVRRISPLANWGTAMLLAGSIYYFLMSRSLGFGMLLFVTIVALSVAALDTLPWPLWSICLALFIVAWIGQFIGHYYEGKRPSFFKDVQFLMIGPLWLLSFVYRRLGIPY